MSWFPSLNITACRKSKGDIDKTPNKMSGKTFLNMLNHTLYNDLASTTNFLNYRYKLQNVLSNIEDHVTHWIHTYVHTYIDT